jgi:hypothetical protein
MVWIRNIAQVIGIVFSDGYRNDLIHCRSFLLNFYSNLFKERKGNTVRNKDLAIDKGEGEEKSKKLGWKVKVSPAGTYLFSTVPRFL